MIIQDDTFISAEQQTVLKRVLMENSSWTFSAATNYETPDSQSILTEHESFQFESHIVPQSPLFYSVKELIDSFLTKHGVSVKDVLRLKTNVLTQSKDSNPHSAHIDADIPHLVFLYYVNDSDGDTVFYDKTWEPGLSLTASDLTEKIRVSPKMGRGVLFDGLQYHASSSPIDSNYRCVINFTFVPN
jgi:hypothetical protein